MLPEIRTSGDIFSIPKFDLDRGDVEGFMDSLKGFHEEFRDCFSREESRTNFFHYSVGQFSEIRRKSIEPIALSVEDAKIRAMQRFISDAIWDEEKMIIKYRKMIDDDMGEENGILIFDESGFQKKGKDSAGVAKQYCSNLGKVENCQVGVFSAYASSQGYSLVDKRLFIPEKWFGDEYMKKREKCNFPKDLAFKTKPQLAVEMLDDIIEQDILQVKYITADSIYGNSPDFITAVEKYPDKTYFVNASMDMKCWLRAPVTEEKPYKYAGEIRHKTVLRKGEKKPLTAIELAKSINSYFWYRRKVSEGTKGPIEYEFTKRRVTLSHGDLPTKEVWLVIKRTLGSDPEYSFYISNAPLSSRLALFVWLSGVRWPIEQCFEEEKNELGMDQYEVRKYTGWNHHMLVCMLSHFFLWHLKIKLGKKSTCGYYCPA
jgi:SRSO17 transposase